MAETKIRILKPGDQPALEAFLGPKIESSMFLISNSRAAGLVDHGQRLQGTYAAAFSGSQISGVVAHFWNQNLVLQAAPHLLEQLWPMAIAASRRPVRGVIGPQQQVQTVLQGLPVSPSDIQVDEPEYLYRLPLAELTLPQPLASGRWRGRLAVPEDIPLITRWRVGYALEALGETESPRLWEVIGQNVKLYIDRGIIWILEDRGQPVATSAFNSRIKEMVQIGGVWTPPELRSQGYGRGVVAASLQAEREQGVHTAILFTGEENIPAQKAYEALGFHRIGDYRITVLNKALHP